MQLLHQWRCTCQPGSSLDSPQTPEQGQELANQPVTNTQQEMQHSRRKLLTRFVSAQPVPEQFPRSFDICRGTRTSPWIMLEVQLFQNADRLAARASAKE